VVEKHIKRSTQKSNRRLHDDSLDKETVTEDGQEITYNVCEFQLKIGTYQNGTPKYATHRIPGVVDFYAALSNAPE
jgi:hypothetical protein